jgi:hypothetical protein
VTVADSMSPGWADGLATVVTEMHHTAGETVLRFMAGTIAKGIDEPDWTARQWGNTAAVQRRTDTVLTGLARDSEREISRAVLTAYRRGYGRDGFDARPARTLTERLMDVLRRVWATWRQSFRSAWSTLIARGSGQPPGDARRAVVQREMDRLADGGITGFRDARGRQWSAPGYVKQAVSHVAGQTVMDGWFAAIADEGRDLVIVPETPTTCPLCAPWLGKILSISGVDPEHASVRTARASGLWHPNCQHPAQEWFPGYRPLEIPFMIRRARAVLYEAAQRERAIERTIRKWQQREAAALDDITRAQAVRRVKHWSAELRRHRAQHGTTPRRAA